MKIKEKINRIIDKILPTNDDTTQATLTEEEIRKMEEEKKLEEKRIREREENSRAYDENLLRRLLDPRNEGEYYVERKPDGYCESGDVLGD